MILKSLLPPKVSMLNSKLILWPELLDPKGSNHIQTEWTASDWIHPYWNIETKLWPDPSAWWLTWPHMTRSGWTCSILQDHIWPYMTGSNWIWPGLTVVDWGLLCIIRFGHSRLDLTPIMKCNCIAGNRTCLYRLPQPKIIMYSFLFAVLLSCETLKNF